MFLSVVLQCLILCVGREHFILLNFIKLELEMKNNILFVICINCEKFIFSQVKLEMVLKTHCQSHNIQSKTR